MVKPKNLPLSVNKCATEPPEWLLTGLASTVPRENGIFAHLLAHIGFTESRNHLQIHFIQLCTYISLTLAHAFRAGYKIQAVRWKTERVAVSCPEKALLFSLSLSLSVCTLTCPEPINLAQDRCLSRRGRRELFPSLPPAGTSSTSPMPLSVCLPAARASQPASKQLHFLYKMQGNILRQTKDETELFF